MTALCLVTFFAGLGRSAIGIGLLEAIAAKQPGEVWINPGAESAALEARARELGLTPVYACSIVALG